MANRALRQHLLLSLAMIGPLLFFVILRFVPATDSVWNQPVPHFYIVSYTSLVALVVAGFVLIGVGTGGGRAMFAAMGFVAMSAFFFVHGISTPGVLIPGFNQAVGWSARLSLTSGAIPQRGRHQSVPRPDPP